MNTESACVKTNGDGLATKVEEVRDGVEKCPLGFSLQENDNTLADRITIMQLRLQALVN